MSLSIKELNDRKKILENRLKKYRIDNVEIKYLPFVDETLETFKEPIEVAKRTIILYAIAHTSRNLEDKELVADWLKKENLWNDVSPIEKKLLNDEITGGQQLINFSWNIEAAYILAWTLGIVKQKPEPTESVDDKHIDEFVNNVPELGAELNSFFENLIFINKSEIYLENLFNELATGYFRDLMFNGKKDKTKIERGASFERHNALNWLRNFSGETEWDNTDTST